MRRRHNGSHEPATSAGVNGRGWRGRGAASKLTGAVVEWAGSQGSQRVRLWVAEGNESARRFYEGRGFEATGGRKPMPGNQALFRDEMALELH